MQNDRQTTVLFADVSGSTRLYESAGDAVASEAIARCLARQRRVVESVGGRVVKTMGDELMAVFPTADAAAAAAAEMHRAMESFAEVAHTKLAVRIGFHSGPVVQRDGDVFGDTVNLASRLVAQAVKGQILTSGDTAGRLGPVFRPWTRRLYSVPVKGKAEQVGLCELVWNVAGELTTVLGSRPGGRRTPVVLRLVYRGREIARQRDNDSLTIGRDVACSLVVDDTMASRQHCTIEWRHDKFVLRDHSTNGTYVTIERDSEILLQREELILRGHGWISFGRPRRESTDVAEYSCD